MIPDCILSLIIMTSLICFGSCLMFFIDVVYTYLKLSYKERKSKKS